MATGLLSAELAATCGALGYFDGEKYHLEPHCKETVKDLIRYLRRDEETHGIRRYLGNSKLLQTDLIPLIQSNKDDKELFDVALRLVVNLTNPALLVYNEVLPKDKVTRNQYLEIVSHLQGYKEAFTDYQPWIVLSERLSDLLNIDPSDRDEDTQRTVERILILVRNVLHVPVNAACEERPDNDASVHDQVVWAIHQSGMLDMVLYIASASAENHFFMHILEIICLLLREQPPHLLGETSAQRSGSEKQRDDQELLQLREQELQRKMAKLRKYQGTRHSNFGGTFVVKNMKSTSNNDMIYHKSLHTVENISWDLEKKKIKLPKNRQPIKCESGERRSALSVRLIMKQFCVEILNAAYNPLMRHVKDLLARGKSQDNDESYYFTALKFFMEFNRCYKFEMKLVSETMSVETFHFIQKYIENWHEMMVTDKDKTPLWSTRLHLALKAYKELLYNLVKMDVSQDSSVRESSRVIKSNIFYVIEYREMLLFLVNTYKKAKYSEQYLRDLIETIHIFLKILKDFGKKKTIFVQKKVKHRTAKKKESAPPTNQESPEESWARISPEVKGALGVESHLNVVPFDPISDQTIDEQKLESIRKIQELLKSGHLEEAVAHFRASREVWPENNVFGSDSFGVEEELGTLREIFIAEIGSAPGRAEEKIDEEADDEEEEVQERFSEHSFDVEDFVKRFASPKVVAICVSLLKNHEKNSNMVNHAVAKMLHRIAWDCKLYVMLFQGTLFRQFQKIFASNNPRFKELGKLGVFVMRKFTELAPGNKSIFMEMLFWKTSREAYDIEYGYGAHTEKAKGKKTWEEHEEEELRRLFAEYESSKPTEDLVEWIMDNMINKDRSKLSVTKKLKELGIIVKKQQKGVTWTEEEEEELRELYEEYKATKNPLKGIKDHMHGGKSTRMINKKLVELGLITKTYDLKKRTTWTEEEDEELASVFNEFRFSEDPVSDIVSNITGERSSQNVIKALLRLGLINDRRELKRKGSRRKKEDSALSPPESSETESDSDVDDNQGRKAAPIENLPEATKEVLSSLRERSFLQEGFSWLRSSFSEVLEDIDSDPCEVPLLPLSEDAIRSVDDSVFTRFLAALGLFPPLEDQERYWRIPVWGRESMISRVELVEFILENFQKELVELREEINPMLTSLVGKTVNISSENSREETDSSEDEAPTRTKKLKRKRGRRSSSEDLQSRGHESSSKIPRPGSSNEDTSESDSSQSNNDEASGRHTLESTPRSRKLRVLGSDESRQSSRASSIRSPQSERRSESSSSDSENEKGPSQQSRRSGGGSTSHSQSSRTLTPQKSGGSDDEFRSKTASSPISADTTPSQKPRSRRRFTALSSDDESPNELDDKENVLSNKNLGSISSDEETLGKPNKLPDSATPSATKMKRKRILLSSDSE